MKIKTLLIIMAFILFPLFLPIDSYSKGGGGGGHGGGGGVMGEDTMEVPMEGITAIPKQVLTTLEGAIFQEIMF